MHKNTWRVHQFSVFLCNLKLAQRKGLQFYQTRPHAIALFNTLPATCIEKVENKTGEDLHCKIQGYRALYLRQICNMDVRILLILERENPPTIKANKACTTGKPIAHFSRTHVASIPMKVSEVSTEKLVAVTLIKEFQVYLTQD